MKMRRIGLTYEFWDPDQGWKMTVSHVKEHGDGIGAYVIVEALPGSTDKPGSPRVIEHGNLNLMSTMTRGRWGKDMDARFPITGHWNDVIGKISLHVIQQLGQGEPVVDLHGDAAFKPVHYLIEPILLKDEPNIIFAEGSAGKSYLSLLLGLMVQLPWAKNPWRFRTPKEPTNVLYLDWEGSQTRTESRLAALVQGMGLNNGSSTVPIIKYRRCSRPLDADVFEVMKWVRDYNIGLIIIDSLMPAQSGDIMDPSAPRSFYMALRELNISSLIIAHLSKEDLRRGAKKKAGVFGSIFNENLSRQIFELIKTETVGRRGSKLALHHRKANYTELQKPIGFQVEFDGPRTIYRPLKVSEDDTLSQDMDLEDRLEELLITMQEGMPGVMAESLEVSVDKVIECLKAHPNRFVPVQNGYWGLLAREGLEERGR